MFCCPVAVRQAKHSRVCISISISITGTMALLTLLCGEQGIVS